MSSQWGALAGTTYASDGGFEEWKVKIYAIPNTISTQVKNTNGTLVLTDDTNIADGGSVVIGTGVYDTATFAGGITDDAGGTVSYYYQKQTGATATCSIASGTLIGAAVTVTNGVVPASATVTLSAAGTYEFWAVYSGDPPDNNASTSTCGSETVVVGPNSPTAATTQNLIPNDKLTLTGATSDAGGTVDFYLFAPGVTCSLANIANAAFTQEDVALTTFNQAATGNTGSGTGSYLATAEGTYQWLAIYSGDANNNPVTSSCVETFTIDNNKLN